MGQPIVCRLTKKEIEVLLVLLRGEVTESSADETIMELRKYLAKSLRESRSVP